MTVIITDTGFSSDKREKWDVTPDTVDLSSDVDPTTLQQDILKCTAIRISFPHFTDGRGLGLARSLRSLGYTGRIRGIGNILPDQYTMMRRVGFDEIEITGEHATIYPEKQWLLRANWKMHNYQQRLQV